MTVAQHGIGSRRRNVTTITGAAGENYQRKLAAYHQHRRSGVANGMARW